MDLLNEFREKLNEYFKAKNYGESIQTIYGLFICVSAEYEPFHPIRKPRLLRKEPALEFEYKLDFDTYKGMYDAERLRYIATGYYSGLNNALTVKKLKHFHSEAFLTDLKDCLLYHKLLNN